MNCLKMHLEDDVDYTLIYLNVNLFHGCSNACSKKSAGRIRILDKFRVLYVRTTTLGNSMGPSAPPLWVQQCSCTSPDFLRCLLNSITDCSHSVINSNRDNRY